jgi:hypothetical protein
VLRGLRSLPGPEDEVVAFDEVDADPRVVLDAIVQQVDHGLQVAGVSDLLQ